jgi:hypothetical protein
MKLIFNDCSFNNNVKHYMNHVKCSEYDFHLKTYFTVHPLK